MQSTMSKKKKAVYGDEGEDETVPKHKKPKNSFSDGSGSNTEKVFRWTPCSRLSEVCGVSPKVSASVARLMDEGNAIPFIARYRKGVTEGMTPDQLRDFRDHYDLLKTLQTKGEKLLKEAKKQSKDNSSFRHCLSIITDLEELETLAKPLVTKAKTTLAARAVTAGLEETANDVLAGKSVNWQKLVDENVDGRRSMNEVTDGVEKIVADVIAHDVRVLKNLEDLSQRMKVLVQSSRAPNTKAALELRKKNQVDVEKFSLYFSFSLPAAAVKPHQALALDRGEKQKALSVKVVVPGTLEMEHKRFCKGIFPAGKIVDQAITDGYKRLAFPWLSRRIRSGLSRLGEQAAAEAFCKNLRSILLEPPVLGCAIMGLDPGFRNGCKAAIISPTGSLLYTGVFYPRFNGQSPLSPEERREFLRLIETHGVKKIALGNGTASRETERMLVDLIKSDQLLNGVEYVIISEQGVSIYSCSKAALLEHGDLDPCLIGAVSIAKRLQDPLAELVKVDPKNIGVGMYQHDLPQTKLKRIREEVISECVSFVGVDLNFAPEHILRRVAGLGEVKAKAIVEHRNKHGNFVNRQQLKKVKGIGDSIFKQCAGFVIVRRDGDFPSAKSKEKPDPLDSLLIHPESYDLARKIITKENFSDTDIGRNDFRLHFKRLHLDQAKCHGLASKHGADEAEVTMIMESLSHVPGQEDLRNRRTNGGPIFRRDITRFEDLKRGDVLRGRVRNVVDFGAFVDIGLGGTSGLIHKSKYGTISRPLEPGDGVRVKVLEKSKSNGRGERISLSLEEIMC